MLANRVNQWLKTSGKSGDEEKRMVEDVKLSMEALTAIKTIKRFAGVVHNSLFLADLFLWFLSGELSMLRVLKNPPPQLGRLCEALDFLLQIVPEKVRCCSFWAPLLLKSPVCHSATRCAFRRDRELRVPLSQCSLHVPRADQARAMRRIRRR